jgi:hypothetical protein
MKLINCTERGSSKADSRSGDQEISYILLIFMVQSRVHESSPLELSYLAGVESSYQSKLVC